jgi:hypothetical protein
MNCDAIIESIPLYLYGELPPETEETVEQHCATCGICAYELKRYKAFSAALNAREIPVPPNLLAECRHALLQNLESARSVPATVPGFLGSMRHALQTLMNSSVRLRVPVGAMALVAVGYFGAHVLPYGVGNGFGGFNTASFVPDTSNVRSVQSESGGRVQISLDETRRRVISGRCDDQNIKRLLLTAAREEGDPGVRVESVDLLRQQAGSEDVRRALLDAVEHDPNPGVRLKALDGLKTFGADAGVRKALAQVLLNDKNPGVRIQVIDMLTAHKDDSMVGVLQNVIRKEDNNYVRTRCQNALQDMHASVGTF